MNAAARAKWRKIGIGAVVVAPILLYTVWRFHIATDTHGFAWAVPAGTSARFEYEPRNAVFDSSRKMVTLAAARGERVVFGVRLQSKSALVNVQVTVDPLPLRERGAAKMGKDAPKPLEASVFGVVRAADGSVSLPPMAPLPSMPAKTAVEWLVEVEIPRDHPPGLYSGMLYVRAGDVGLDRMAVGLHVSSAQLGGCAPVLGERIDVWKAPALVTAGGTCDDSAPGTMAGLRKRMARDDRRYLDLLRARKDPVVEGLVARVVASPPQSDDAWLGVRAELVGLLNAPGAAPVPAPVPGSP